MLTCMQILRMWLIVVEIVRHFVVVPLLLLSIRKCLVPSAQ